MTSSTMHLFPCLSTFEAELQGSPSRNPLLSALKLLKRGIRSLSLSGGLSKVELPDLAIDLNFFRGSETVLEPPLS